MQEKKQYFTGIFMFFAILIKGKIPNQFGLKCILGDKIGCRQCLSKMRLFWSFPHYCSILLRFNEMHVPRRNVTLRLRDKISNLVVDLSLFADILIDDNRSPIFRICKVWFFRLNPKAILIWRRKRNRAP